MKKIRYELILWLMWVMKCIPGNIGCFLRSKLLSCRIGKGSKIWDRVQIDYPSKLVVGSNCSINRGVVLNCGGNITIGNDVLIGPNVVIYSQNHQYTLKSENINNQGYIRKNVIIEDDCWIASNAIILPGVIVKKGTVIGAGSIVTKDTEMYSVYVGNPAKKISNRK